MLPERFISEILDLSLKLRILKLFHREIRKIYIYSFMENLNAQLYRILSFPFQEYRTFSNLGILSLLHIEQFHKISAYTRLPLRYLGVFFEHRGQD